MRRRPMIIYALAGLVSMSAGVALAKSHQGGQGKGMQPQSMMQHPVPQQQRMLATPLMTQQERDAFRRRMREADTVAEREQIRLEHRHMILERSQARGITLPDMPPANGQGMGRGSGKMR